MVIFTLFFFIKNAAVCIHNQPYLPPLFYLPKTPASPRSNAEKSTLTSDSTHEKDSKKITEAPNFNEKRPILFEIVNCKLFFAKSDTSSDVTFAKRRIAIKVNAPRPAVLISETLSIICDEMQSEM